MEKLAIFSLAVILLGIFLLGFTFYLAYSAFINPEILTKFNILIPGISATQPFSQLTVLIGYVVAFLLLWVMGSMAGKMVKYGIDIHKVFSKRRREKEEKKE